MIKHAEGRYLSSELTMHFGLIPRTNRGIFCINELPDLAPKIQVGLFNVLEERDVQIRGYPVRLDLDLCMVFSANPEDYTNRGRIVTPLKDRIGSVIRTHYPLSREIGIAISDQNAWLDRTIPGRSRLAIPLYIKEIVEEVARLARSSPHVNQQSGVSVRMSIANLENVVSNAERRAIFSRERTIVPRISDLGAAAASSRGKLELTMAEDESNDDKLIARLIGEAVKNVFTLHIDLRELRPMVEHFESGQSVEVGDSLPARGVLERIAKVPGLKKRADELAGKLLPELTDRDDKDAAAASVAEFILEGLHVHNKLNKSAKDGATSYRR
jgi:magnesium chelatase subunit I